MDKEAVINQLISIRDNGKLPKSIEENEDIEALNTAISILRKEQSRRFNRSFSDRFLDEIIEEYFSDDTQRYGLGMWEVIDYVKGKYKDEIATLPV